VYSHIQVELSAIRDTKHYHASSQMFLHERLNTFSCGS